MLFASAIAMALGATAISNDRGLIINGIIKFSAFGATIFYWVLAVVFTLAAVMGFLYLILYFSKQEIILSEDSISVPDSVGKQENRLIMFQNISRISLHKKANDIYLVIQHLHGNTWIPQSNLSSKESFQQFLEDFHTATTFKSEQRSRHNQRVAEC